MHSFFFSMSAWDVARLTVNLGDHNIKTTTETRHVVKKVKRVVRHRGFDSNTLVRNHRDLDMSIQGSLYMHT